MPFFECHCGSQWNQTLAEVCDGAVPPAVDECALCPVMICENCRVTVRNSKGEKRYICEGCRDALMPQEKTPAQREREDEIQSLTSPTIFNLYAKWGIA